MLVMLLIADAAIDKICLSVCLSSCRHWTLGGLQKFSNINMSMLRINVGENPKQL